MSVVVETTVGDFTVDLYTKERPQTCRNFLKLCKVKYYNWNLFFTVQNNFIAQTGDPTSTGKGGESIYGMIFGEQARYYEAEQMPKIKHDKAGLLSMVNCGDNMLASQFFITLSSDLKSLDGEHCVFGEISEGLEIILKFNETICDVDHRPYQDIRISHTVILEDPYEDPKGLVIPDRSPEPTKEVLMSDRIGADEIIDDTAGMSMEEINEMQKAKEAKARATILEIVGDIPDAEMAPPENVLFVCKLNPVTNDDDLEIIFSRFGKIIGCEVIRDRQTGDSLQYAFIEFAERKSCEEAYFKMDNVLIDDRRIHVDFSQSVAKMRWRGKGKGIKYFDDENEIKNRKKDKSRDHNKDKNDRRPSGSESPKKEENYYGDKDKYDRKKDTRKIQECKDDNRKRNDKDKNLNRKRQERSRSNERNWDRKGRSRSNERNWDRKRRSRSNERNWDNKGRSRSNEKTWDRKGRSRSNEKTWDRKGRSRSNERNWDNKGRSRSNEGNWDNKGRSQSREKIRDRKARSKEKSKEKRERSREKKGRSNEWSKDKSREGKDKKENNEKNKTEKRKKKEYDRKGSEERDARYSNNKKRQKSRDKSEERYERSGLKHKHKYKSR